jgi:hypothetical protein
MEILIFVACIIGIVWMIVEAITRPTVDEEEEPV